MPPQPGTFALSPFGQSHKSRSNNYEAPLGPQDSISNYMNVASSSRSAGKTMGPPDVLCNTSNSLVKGYGEDPKRTKKPRDFAGRLAKELYERRDE